MPRWMKITILAGCIAAMLLGVGAALLNMTSNINEINLRSENTKNSVGRRFIVDNQRAQASAEFFTQNNTTTILLKAKDGGSIVAVGNLTKTREFIKQLKSIHDIKYIDNVESAVGVEGGGTDELSPQDAADFFRLGKKWRQIVRYEVSYVPEYISEGTMLIRAVETHVDPKSAPAQKLIRDIRAIQVPGLEVEIIGESARWADVTSCAVRYMTWVIGFVVAGIFFFVLMVIQIKRKLLAAQ